MASNCRCAKPASCSSTVAACVCRSSVRLSSSEVSEPTGQPCAASRSRLPRVRDLAVTGYTSGTTGLPEGTVLANEELTRPARARFDEPAARAVASVHVPRVFSTVGLPEVRRIELWESHNAAALIGLSCHTTGPDSLEATELNLQIGQVQLARVAGSAHVIERTAGVIRRTPADAIAVYLTFRGDAWFEDEGGSRALRPGHVLICDADRPFARGFARGLEELAIKVPRLAFTENTGLASLRSPILADFRSGGDPYARALASLTGRAARSERAVPADERTLPELVTVLAVGRDAGPSLAYRAAARSFIEAHLPDPGLTASRVAAAIGISERPGPLAVFSSPSSSTIRVDEMWNGPSRPSAAETTPGTAAAFSTARWW